MRQKTEYFSKYTHPDMKVIDALCMSIAVPFIFSSYRYNNMVYEMVVHRKRYQQHHFSIKNHIPFYV